MTDTKRQAHSKVVELILKPTKPAVAEGKAKLQRALEA